MLENGYLHQNEVEFHVIGPIVNLATPTESLTCQTGHLLDTGGLEIYEPLYWHERSKLSIRRSLYHAEFVTLCRRYLAELVTLRSRYPAELFTLRSRYPAELVTLRSRAVERVPPWRSRYFLTLPALPSD